MEYHKVILTFIDYLGFKNLVYSDEEPEKIYKKMQNFVLPLQGITLGMNDKYKLDDLEKRRKEQLKKLKEEIEMEIEDDEEEYLRDIGHFSTEFYFFSDTVIRITDVENLPEKEISEVFKEEIDFLIHALLNLLRNNLLARGIITIGKSYHSKRVFFGPALIKAHLMENSKVIYPRICIDKEITNKIFFNDEKSYNKRILSTMLTQDFDGMFFIDYLKYVSLELLDSIKQINSEQFKRSISQGYIFKHTNGNIENEIKDLQLQLEKNFIEAFTNSKKTIEQNLKNVKEEYIEKIFWLKNYHNRTLRNFGKDLKEKSNININDFIIND